jgi:hypothetical protein
MKPQLQTLNYMLHRRALGEVFQETPKLKPGYCVTVTSWENDADNYKTASIDGLSLNDTETICRILYLLHVRANPDSNNYTNSSKYFGNISEHSYDIRIKAYNGELKHILSDNLTFFQTFNFDCGVLTQETLDELEDELEDYVSQAFLQDIQCCGLSDGIYYTTRAVESITIDYIE